MIGDIPSHIGSKLGEKTPKLSDAPLLQESESDEKNVPEGEGHRKEANQSKAQKSPELAMDNEKLSKKRIKKRPIKKLRKGVAQLNPMEEIDNTSEKEIINSEPSNHENSSLPSPKIASAPKVDDDQTQKAPNNISPNGQEQIDHEIMPASKLQNIISAKDMTGNNSKSTSKSIKRKTSSKSPTVPESKKAEVLVEKYSALDQSKKERQLFLENLRKDTADYLKRLKKEREARSEDMKLFRANLRKELSAQIASIRDDEAKRQEISKK